VTTTQTEAGALLYAAALLLQGETCNSYTNGCTAGDEMYTEGYVQTAATLATTGVVVESECKLERCEGAKTCTIAPFVYEGTPGVFEYEYELTGGDGNCPAPPTSTTSGTSGGSGPDAADEAAAGTVQASLGLLLAALALVAFAQ